MKCKYCNKKLIISNKGRKKRFCNANCGSNWRYHNLPYYKERTKKNTIKSYNRLKGSPKFKTERKKRFDIWLNNNREHFNDLCRDRSRLHERKVRKLRRKLGLCLRCGKEKEEGFICCKSCRDKSNFRDKVKSAEWKLIGLCPKCGKVRKDKKYLLCQKCRSHFNKWRRQR